jgi:hypothetical protein
MRQQFYHIETLRPLRERLHSLVEYSTQHHCGECFSEEQHKDKPKYLCFDGLSENTEHDGFGCLECGATRCDICKK